MVEQKSLCWDVFLIHGELLFNYLIHNFESMINRDLSIIDFEIVDRQRRFAYEIDKINEIYYDNIQKELEIWIMNEYKNNKLFEKNNWKPFRDLELMTDMFLGYKYMFQYKQYYFQLAIESNYFISENTMNNNTAHFELVLYGWKNEQSEKLQPDDKVIIISPDNIMPERYWEIK